ncbi:MAG: transketolase [Oscillospiraceae bacterium]|jgi:transketolase|nr:transketolase [Oscillospiraceae bacterium]
MDKELSNLAAEIRIAALECLGAFGSGHVGGAMSVVETLAVLYGSELRHDPRNPDWDARDRLVLSKGHAGPALYATLALRGFFPREELATLNQGGTHLPSHVDRTKTPGVDMTCGSLGQGMSAAIGLAYGARLNGSDSRTYLILGDGECDEGQVWEGAMFAAHNKLANLTAFVDRNKQQLDGYVSAVLDTGDMGEKFRAFGWYTQDVNGHDVAAIRAAVENAKREAARPSAIILDTIKGYGCTFAEGVENNHSMTCSKEDVAAAIAAIRATIS